MPPHEIDRTGTTLPADKSIFLRYNDLRCREGLEAYFQNQKEFTMNKKSIFVTFKRLFIILGGGYMRNPSFMREFS